MARRTPQTQAKRLREIAKADKRCEKAKKRALRKLMKSKEFRDDTEAGEAQLPESDGSESRSS